MRDVADAAGVSAQTVSRALRDHPNVQSETKQRVNAAARKLGYRRNATARALVTGRSNMIGVITLSTSSYSRLTLMSGIEQEAAERGFAVTFVSIASLTPRALEAGLDRLHDQGVDAVITSVPLREPGTALVERLAIVPTVAIDGPEPPDDEAVSVDQVAAARMAVEHLISLGHNNVWHIAGPPEWIESEARVRGWRLALRAADLEQPPMLRGDWSAASGHREGLLLARIPEVTAVLVASDEMAFGVIRALTDQGVRVPQDVSVVGIDDIELSAFCSPPLTTVRQSFVETGRRAVARIHALLSHHPDEDDATAHRIQPELIVRASTAAPSR